LNAEPDTLEHAPAETAPDPWWTAAVPGLVVATGIVAGLGLGTALGAAPGAIFLGGSVLVGAILLFWSSVRLLLGEKLPGVDLSDETSGHVLEDPLLEQKRAALAALQDMERERELGKIGAADYDEVVLPLRERAKSVLMELDARAAPYRDEAERLANAHLKKIGVSAAGALPRNVPLAIEPKPGEPVEAVAADPAPSEAPPTPPTLAAAARRICASCETANDPDAKFCKSCGKTMENADAS